MRWVLIDLLLALLALGGLGVVALGLWRQVKGLGREVARAGAAIGTATDSLAEAHAARPDLTAATPSPPATPTRARGRRR
ncbi:MAG: hypothetical protein JWN35_795 [Frankiales bacterium]|nr:hypothetical protein [Frankiales bacterium]